jgi:hypothetical protein
MSKFAVLVLGEPTQPGSKHLCGWMRRIRPELAQWNWCSQSSDFAATWATEAAAAKYASARLLGEGWDWKVVELETWTKWPN